MNMLETIVPKSDQLNADDLIGRNLTIKITAVDIKGGQEQPVAIHFEGDNGKPYKACKSMCRIMVSAWGPDSSKYVGRSMTLYRDASVKWGGLAVGGIRISHMSDIAEDMTMALTVTRANKKPFTVRPITAAQLNSTVEGSRDTGSTDRGSSGGDNSPTNNSDRTALRLADAEAIAGCKTEPELSALVAAMKKTAGPDKERRQWIIALAEQRDAALTEEFTK